MGRDTRALVAEIEAAAAAGRWAELAQSWRELARTLELRGVPLAPDLNQRLMAAIHQSGAFLHLAGAGSALQRDNEKSERLEDQIVTAADPKTFNAEALEEAAGALAHMIRTTAITFDTQDADRVLAAFKSARAFQWQGTYADLLLSRGDTRPSIWIHYAQALIETNRMVAAIEILSRLAADPTTDRKNREEAEGLIGRAYKQIYVNQASVARPLPAVRAALDKSISTYARLYNPDRPAENYWQGINALALLVRARNDGIQPSLAIKPEALAQKLIDALAPKVRADGEPWIAATVAEAHLALDQWDKAAEYFGYYVAQKNNPDAFHLGGTLRQLREVWQLDRHGEKGAAILQALSAKLLELERGHLVLSNAERVAMLTLDDGGVIPEAILGTEGPRTVRWLKTGLERAQGVARIRLKSTGQTFGTGFVVRGSDIARSLGDDLYVLTNAHVCGRPDQLEASAVGADLVEIAFDEAVGGRTFGPFVQVECVWQSGIHELDASLLKVSDLRDQIAPLPIAQAEPAVTPKKSAAAAAIRSDVKVYIIGHPLGRELSVSFDDSDLLEVGPRSPAAPQFRYLKYRTPTEPGNSGSPVFNRDWQVVGLHRAGGRREAFAAGASDVATMIRGANEGVSIVSIRDKVADAVGSKSTTTGWRLGRGTN